MNNDLATRVELLKLARILDTEPAELAFLARQDASRLRALRQGVTEALFERFRASFSGFARLSTLLPLTLGARVSERVLGPMLSGRVAGEMPPERAIDLAARLSDTFLAEICLALDPERSKAIIVGMPVNRVVAITRILQARGEYITMGRFVDVLPQTTLLAATDAIDSDEALLQISFFVEDTAQLTRVIEHLSESRRTGAILAAARHDLWPEAIATIEGIEAPARAQLGELALQQDDATLDSLIRAAAGHDLWPPLMHLAGQLSAEARERLAAQPALAEDDVIRSIVDSVSAHDRWADFCDQLTHTPPERCELLLAAAAEHNPDFIARLAKHTANASAPQQRLAEGAARLSAATRSRVVAACGDTPLAAALEGD